MNWLDNAIAFISPEWGARRAAWRGAYDEVRNYDAGNMGRLNTGWRASNMSAEMTDRGSRDYVRARARDLERNSDVMNSVLGAYKRNVIGHGFQLQAKTGNEPLNEELEKLWKKWCKARNCDVTGTQSLNELLRMAVVRKKVDGGILFVKRYTRDGMVPFSLQMIEVDELDAMQTVPKNSSHRVVGGVEYNEYNRPFGYWIRQYQLDGFSLSEPEFIKADDVIFYYTKKRPSQVREISDMSPTLTRVRDVNEFMTAVSVKQRIEACLSVFIKKSLPVSGMGRPSNSGTDERFSYDGKTLTPGMIRELNAGDDVFVVNPTGQSADATSFVKLQQRLIGAGQGVSYEATARDMSQSTYSSARQGMIEDEMTFGEEKEQIFAILDEIYESFVISCFLAGKISAADFWNNKEEYFGHEWISQPKQWIDPEKEAKATKIALNSGIRTYKQICAENGVDWRQQLEDLADIEKTSKDLGLDGFLGGVLFDGKLKEENSEDENSGSPEASADSEDADDAESGEEDSADESDGDSDAGEGQEQGDARAE